VSEAEALADARARWDSVGVSEYQLQVGKICFCAPEVTAPVVVTVRGDEVVDVRYAEGRPEGAPDVPEDAPTVETLFDAVERAIDEADELQVEYDPELGYPTRIGIDFDTDVVDEELGYEAVVLSHSVA
jgi:hypothetical protein